MDELLRSLTEIRLTLREDALRGVTDEQLEQGEVDLKEEKSTVRIGYFAYLVMAEIQERLISEIC